MWIRDSAKRSYINLDNVVHLRIMKEDPNGLVYVFLSFDKDHSFTMKFDKDEVDRLKNFLAVPEDVPERE